MAKLVYADISKVSIERCEGSTPFIPTIRKKSTLKQMMAVYDLCSESGKRYQVNIDLSDKYDVSDTAVFQTHYDKALTLMRWIRKVINNNQLYVIKE